ncbi:hypothetical protein NDU88_004043 [Pleurodeles waltl]|uniref:Uncharacterized protein n=1 Tax=Pleurodeles waltl TaxID=8319 RepID=A0AAV7LH70_PLEWA|nr:hypothetical protein NDU88_004043 [Pleurodeles waltl]
MPGKAAAVHGPTVLHHQTTALRPQQRDPAPQPTDLGGKPQAHLGRAEMSSGWRAMRSAAELRGKAPMQWPS